MVSVASLLNPVTNFSRDAEDYSPSPARKILQLTPAPVDPAQETKVSKPTATRVKGQAKGEVKYPPYESVDDELAAAYEQFKVQPIGHISDYPKRIPYSSEKKTFHLKTGRNGFEGELALAFTNEPSGTDLYYSLSVHIQNAQRRVWEGGLLCNVGLQCRTGEDYGIVQESEALQGL